MLGSLVPLWLVRKKEPSDLPPVYSFIFHPYLSWVDVIIGMIFPFILPLEKLLQFPPSKESKKTLECNGTFREALKNGVLPAFSGEVSAYTKATGIDMAETIMSVRRQLGRWKGLSLDDSNFSDKELSIVLFYPTFILSGEQQAKATAKNDRGFVEVENFDINSVSDEVPLIVHFHGGGLTLGSPFYDLEGFKIFSKLLTSQQQRTETPVRAIFASVKYSLAPEYPFPSAPIDALTAVLHFIETNPKRPIHLSGVSAGGYLAAIATMECHNIDPDRIQSSLSFSPMMNPLADTLSMYQNATSAKICPAPWIRWCWQAYLEMPPSPQEDDGSESNGKDDNTFEHVLGRGSNRKAWEESKWRGSKWEPWIRPDLHLPEDLSATNTRFLVSTNRGDALYSEGAEYAKKLREAGVKFVRWFDFGGSHCLGTTMVSKNFNEVTEAWREAIFRNQ